MFKSNIYDKQTSGGKNMPVDYYGRVRIAHGAYTFDGKEGSSSQVAAVKLPKGARVLANSRVYTENMPEALIAAGIKDSKTKFMGFGKAADNPFMDAGAGEFILPAAEDLILTFDGNIAKGAKVVFDIFFVTD